MYLSILLISASLCLSLEFVILYTHTHTVRRYTLVLWRRTTLDRDTMFIEMHTDLISSPSYVVTVQCCFVVPFVPNTLNIVPSLSEAEDPKMVMIMALDLQMGKIPHLLVVSLCVNHDSLWVFRPYDGEPSQSSCSCHQLAFDEFEDP